MSDKLSVTFESRGPGRCQWCGQQRADDVYEAAFSDRSFVGLYCWKDLQRAVNQKCPERKPKPPQPTIPMPQQAAK